MEKQAEYNAGVRIDKLIDELPAGLDRALLRVLSFHTGRGLAIGRGDLVRELKRHGFDVHERAARACINQLRKQGFPIGSTGGEDGGYWICKSWNEVKEYVDRELTSRIIDLAETKAGMLRGAQERWGEGIQERLF
jgi:predicted DNA-binding transcriptional regulator YafY